MMFKFYPFLILFFFVLISKVYMFVRKNHLRIYDMYTCYTTIVKQLYLQGFITSIREN